MNRLTNYNCGKYSIKCSDYRIITIDFDNGFISGNIVDTIGKLEDVMEKHNIENANELDHALDVLEMFKQSIKVTRIDPPVEPIIPNEKGEYIAPLTRYLVEVQRFNMDSALRKALTEWIKQNIDKETIFKWLGVYKGEQNE